MDLDKWEKERIKLYKYDMVYSLGSIWNRKSRSNNKAKNNKKIIRIVPIDTK